jgi:hypothetical protein
MPAREASMNDKGVRLLANFAAEASRMGDSNQPFVQIFLCLSMVLPPPSPCGRILTMKRPSSSWSRSQIQHFCFSLNHRSCRNHDICHDRHLTASTKIDDTRPTALSWQLSGVSTSPSATNFTNRSTFSNVSSSTASLDLTCQTSPNISLLPFVISSTRLSGSRAADLH